MKIISHRGNIDSIDPTKENTLIQIKKVLSLGFDIEIDLWYINSRFYLGHDCPGELADLDFIGSNLESFWMHCKNIEAITAISDSSIKSSNYFFHDKDSLTLTSKGIPWCYPGVYIEKGITVQFGRPNLEIPRVLGICTDYPAEFKKHI